MSSHPLVEAAERLTAANNRSPAPPPAAALTNPLTELLIQDVENQLPEELRQTLRGSCNASTALDWIGVASLWRSIGRADDRETFLSELARDPKHVARAWAKALAPEVGTPKPSRRQFWLDAVGLALQFGLVAAFFVARWTVVSLFAAPVGLGGILFLPLLGAPAAQRSRPFLGLVSALALTAIELSRGSRWMERLRRLPTVCGNERPLWTGRTDAFFVAWRIQCIPFGVAIICRLFGR